MDTTSPFARRIHEATHGELADGDGAVEVGPALPGPCDALAFFPGRIVVAADVDEDWVAEQLHQQRDRRPEDASSGLGRFIAAMVERLGHPPAYASVLTAAPHRPTMLRGELTTTGRPDRGWAPYRSDVQSYHFDSHGVTGDIDLGRGPAGRWDTVVRVDGDPLGGGSRHLLTAALTLGPKGGELYGSAPIHDVRALRTMLAGGFRPVCTEVLMLTRPDHGLAQASADEPAASSDHDLARTQRGQASRGLGRFLRPRGK